MLTRTNVQEVALRAVSQLGYGQAALRAYHGSKGLPHLDHLDGVDDRIRNYRLPDDERKGYVLVSMLRGSAGISFRSAVLAHAFRVRGYEPILLRYDESVDQCPLEDYRRNHSAVTDICVFNAVATAEAFGLETVAVADLLSESYEPPEFRDPSLDQEEYAGIDLAWYAKGSTRKYFRRHTIDLDDERDREIYVRNLKSAARIADACSRLLDEVDIAAALATEVVYVHGGVPLAVAHERGTPAYSHDMGYRDETVMFGRFGNREPQPQFTNHDALTRILETPLDETENRRLDRIMTKRSEGKETIHNYSSLTDESVDRADAEVVVGMFTNLIWDASLEVKRDDVAFPNVFDWIDATIDRVASQDGITLVVKTHPAEAQRGTNESVAGRIRDRHGPLPSNVVLLDPDTDVSTYALVRDIDAGVVYNTTVGVEMAYYGVPAVVGGDTHYRGLGFTHDPTTRREYFEALESPETLAFTDEMHERARRYAYTMFIRQNVEFPFSSVDETFRDFKIGPVSHDDLVPGNENIDFIVDRVLQNQPIVRT